jgi:sugar lactone lactonase YvrE
MPWVSRRLRAFLDKNCWARPLTNKGLAQQDLTLFILFKGENQMKNLKKCLPWLVFLLFILFTFSSSEAALAAGPKVLDQNYKMVRLVKDTLFPGCNGATIGLDGALYIVHTGNGQISRVDLKTMKVSRFVPPYGGIFITDDITSDDNENLYVTGTTPLVGEVYRINRHGVKTVLARGLTAPNGIQYNKRTGQLFTTECFQANRIFELDIHGVKEPRLLVKENVIPVPEGFDFDPKTNDLIIPDMGTGKILRVNPKTGAIATIAEKFTAPIALKIGPDNMAYFPELGGAVYRLSLDGQKREKLAQLPPGLDNLAITKEGRLFITSYWDATVYEVSTNGSGKFKTLFPTGPNQILGVIDKKGKILISDAIMIRTLEKDKYVASKLNAWAAHGMPLTLGLADGPGDQVFWPDCINNAVAIGDPVKGEFKAVAGELNRPMAVLMSKTEPKIYVAEYGAGQITEVSLKDGAKKVLVKGLEGPLALAVVDVSLYVAEAKLGRISKVDPETGKAEVFISGVVGKVGALGNDGKGNLLALDGASGRLFRINPENLAVSVIAENLPVGYGAIGSYPGIEFPIPMTVNAKGNIYIPTADRGLIMLEKKK